MAGEDLAALKSSVISDMPVSHGGGNHNKDKLVDHANATNLAPKIMNDVKFALNHISQRSKTIILLMNYRKHRWQKGYYVVKVHIRSTRKWR
ncbi:hypothetical protein [Ligilactobacillus aviarius]|uniref:hypothetical protein n=1 Tax=Ligilactobacillus aviarius TaxID=1606 RepID=UPI0024B958E9|nr:hypothetical protein [Ligilactobacillus aviarius]